MLWVVGPLAFGLEEQLRNTERALTAAAGPSARGPYRHALAMRPPRKARPFGFLNYAGAGSGARGTTTSHDVPRTKKKKNGLACHEPTEDSEGAPQTPIDAEASVGSEWPPCLLSPVTAFRLFRFRELAGWGNSSSER